MSQSHTKSADEVLTNHASDTGRWLRLCASIESREDFNDFFPSPALALTSHADEAGAAALLPGPGGIGIEAPPAVGGASSGGAR